MAVVCSIPTHFCPLDSKVEKSCRKISAHRTQNHSCSTRSGKSTEVTKRLVGKVAGNLRIDGSKALQEGGHDFGPESAIGAANHDQPLWSDPCFPCHRRAEPATLIEDCDGFGGRGRSHERDPHRGESTTRRADQTEHPARGNGKVDGSSLPRLPHKNSLRSRPPSNGALLR